MARRTLPVRAPVDLRHTLGVLRHGLDDPTIRLHGREALRATRTPDGPGTVHLRHLGDRIDVEAWGPGAAWCLANAPRLAGLLDDTTSFDPGSGLVARLHHAHPGLRLARTGRVVEALVPAILEQRVTGFEATRAYHQLLARWGEPAPGPGGLTIGPPGDALAEIPYYELHVIGVEKKRADALRRVGAHAARLDALEEQPLAEARARLRALPGVGAWTVAEVAMAAFGDADAVSVGDYHLKHAVCFALAGEPRGSDARMLELLEPYAGHRGRVCRLVVAGRIGPRRRAPRQRVQAISRR